MKKIILILLLLSSLGSFAQAALNPVTWTYSYEATNDKEGYIILKAVIGDKWHIYSQKQAADGPIPTSFTYKENSGYIKVGTTEEPRAEKTFSEVFGIDVVYFSKEVVFKQKIQRKSMKSFEIKGELEFMACNDNSCLPPKTVPFTISVPAAVKSKK